MLIRLPAVSFCLLLFAACQPETNIAPDFALSDIDGNSVRLYALLEDGPVVFVTWAMWSNTSMEELDSLAVSGATGLDHVQFLAVNLDDETAVFEVESTAIAHGWDTWYTVVYDPMGTLVDLYDIDYLPTTIGIDTTRDIVLTWPGYTSGDDTLLCDTLQALFAD